MQRLRASVRIAAVGLLLAAGGIAPAVMTGAAHAMAVQLPVITGTVVATPQAALPATLLLQVGGQTLAVSITGATRLQRSDHGGSSLTEFTDGDSVAVYGTPSQYQSGVISASLIRNLSVQRAYTNLDGTVASVNPPATVPTTITLTGLSAPYGARSPYPTPLPAQIDIPVSAATTIIIGGVTQPAGAAIGQIAANDRVSVVGVYDRFTNRFDSIENIRKGSPTPPVRLTIDGTLAAAPGQLVAPTILCVLGAQVSTNVATPHVATISPCPPGQTPVYVGGATKIVRLFNETSGLFELSAGDSLHVTATLINAQLQASVVQDRSIHFPTVTGTVQGITSNGNIPDVTIAVTAYQGATPPIAAGSQIVLPLANSGSPNCIVSSAIQFPCTSVTTSAGTTNGYTPGELTVGQTMSARGVYNTQLGRFLAIAHVDGGTPPPPAAFTITGTLAGAPTQLALPVILCVRDAQVSTNVVTPRVAIVSPCPRGQTPVAVTGATRIVRRDGGHSDLDELNVGDALQVTANLINTQFTATLIKDLSIRDDSTSVTGTVSYVSFATRPAYFVIRVGQASGRDAGILSGRTLVVYVDQSTKIATANGTTNAITVLNPGQTVTVLGLYDRQRGGFVDTDRIRIH